MEGLGTVMVVEALKLRSYARSLHALEERMSLAKAFVGGSTFGNIDGGMVTLG